MKEVTTLLAVVLASTIMAVPSTLAQQDQPEPMSFFVASVGLGNGADLGGLAGADAHCQALAGAAGRGEVTWRAYLSTQGASAINARDRIGDGPWHNANGFLIARDLAHLHGDTLELARRGNGMHAFHALDQNGEVINGQFDEPNQHDILTGSMADGRAFTDGEDHTCSNWSSAADGQGSVQVGHHDRIGFQDNSWNSSHSSAGCSQENLIGTGGAGLLYCFAVN